MNIDKFKNKLDNREFWRQNSKEIWDAAYKWQEKANEEDNPIKWRWDCGLKLDYDGVLCRVSSRFYPPHKSSADYGKYYGTISFMLGDETLHEYEIEASSLDELKKIVEDYVSSRISKINNAIKNALK